MDGGGEGVLRGGIKRGWWRRRGELAATERKGLRVKRARGGRHGISLRSPPPLLSLLPPPPPPPSQKQRRVIPSLVRNHIPSALLPVGWRIIGGECTGRRIFGFCEFVLWGAKEKKGEITSGSGERDSLCRRECMLPSMSLSPVFRIVFFNASSAGAGPREIDRTANRCGTAGGVRLPGGNKKERRAALAGPESCRGRGLVRATAQARRHVGLWQHG
jgi:hypothetical protein